MLAPAVHRRIFVVLLALLGVAMVSSVWLANLAWVLLGVNWLLEGRWREKWSMARQSRLLHLFVALYAVLLFGMLWTGHQATGWSVLQVKLPLLCLPLVLLTTRPLTGNARKAVLLIYTAGVVAFTLVGLVRWLTIPDLPYRQLIPHGSHIRFALNCCMVIYLSVGAAKRAAARHQLVRRSPRQRVATVAGASLLVVWMVAFLVLMRSLTAFAVLIVVSGCLVLFRHRRWPAVALWVAVVGGIALGISHEVRNYYRLIPLAAAPLSPLTANGNPYTHAQDGIVENGNYINNYVCTDEMRAEWNRRSTLDFDSCTASGYSVSSTLTRYLNALGLTKDSLGVSQLTPQQIAAISRGTANPLYDSAPVPRRALYTMLFELEYYRHTHAVAGFSMLQRLELWRTALRVIAEHPWCGVGTGDVADAMQSHLAAAGSELSGRGMPPHNQYLGLAAAVGLIGLGFIVVMLLRAVCQRRLSPLMLAWLLTALLSMLTEDTLNTLMGILFCTFFLAVRDLHTSPPPRGDGPYRSGGKA